MQVRRVYHDGHDGQLSTGEHDRRREELEGRGPRYEVVDDTGMLIPEIAAFLRHLVARDCSPNTVSAYAHDLLYLARFLAERGWQFVAFTPARSLEFLEYLKAQPNRRQRRRLQPVLCQVQVDGGVAPGLAATTINRILAAVSSFYDFHLLAGTSAHTVVANGDRPESAESIRSSLSGLSTLEHPLPKVEDPAYARVVERHQPFNAGASRQHPLRRLARVKTWDRLPRPLPPEQIAALFSTLTTWRDKALFTLMLQGGLRPGEALNLRLEDIQYGRRAVAIRARTDHPHGVRTKSRRERMVDLHEPEALEALATYVLRERPQETGSAFVFLVGGKGKRRGEPLSYQAVVKLFARRCERLGIRTPWTTPHALRHTHATAMWEGGMRELTLMKRLGHASVESTRQYTRVADRIVVAEYDRALGSRSD